MINSDPKSVVPNSEKPIARHARKKVLKTFCTSAEAAQLLGVALRTVQLWSENGLLEVWKTSGGHRRISRESVQRLLVGQNKRATDRGPEADTHKPTLDTRGKAFNVLVVEDDEVLRHLYKINIERWPLHTTFASAGDGYEALIRMGQSKPDLLILDLNMPGMDGFRMLQTVRGTAELAGMSIVVVSGIDAAEIQSRGGVPAGVRVLPKPIPFHELQTMAEQIARQQPAGAQTT